MLIIHYLNLFIWLIVGMQYIFASENTPKVVIFCGWIVLILQLIGNILRVYNN